MSDETCLIGGRKYKIGAHGFVYTLLLGEWQRTTAVDAETVERMAKKQAARCSQN